MMIRSQYIKNKETVNNFIWRSLQIFGKQGITFLIFLLCAKLLTPYEFGVYNYVLAIIFFLIIFGDFGISTATSKYVAEYNITNKDKLRAVLFNSGLIILILTIILLILTVIMGPVYLKEKYIYILYLLPLIFLAPMTSLYDGIYRGLKKFKSLAIISLITGFVSLSFVYFFVKSGGLVGALFAQSLFYLLLFLSLALGYRDFHFKINKTVMKEVGKYSLIIGTSTLGYYLFARINIVILGHFNYILETGYYGLINTVFMLLLIPFTIWGNVTAPDITQLYYKNKIKKIFSLYKKTIFWVLVVAVVLGVVTFFLFPPILKHFLSQYYNPTIILTMNLLLIVLITQCVATVVSCGFSTFTGHAKLNMYWLLSFGILNLPVTITLIKIFGFMGVIYSTILIRIISDISFIGYYYYTLKNEIKK